MSVNGKKFAIGVDYGTNSVRALIVDLQDGTEIATAVSDYPTGDMGIILDRNQPTLARQSPRDYVDCFMTVVREAVELAKTASPGAKRNIRTFRRRTRGSGKIIPRSKKPTRSPRASTNSTTAISTSAAESTAPNGTGLRSGIACAKIPKSLTRRTPGSNSPTSFPAILPGTASRKRWRAASARRATKRCGIPTTAGFRPRNFSRPSSRSLSLCANGLPPTSKARTT